MKKFYPMALLLKLEGYPPAVIASVALHACLFSFILGRSVDSSDFVTIEDPVIVTASTVDVNPQRLRRLERLEQERITEQRRQDQAERDRARAREREQEEARQQEVARQRAAEQEAQRQREAEVDRARDEEEARQRRLAEEARSREEDVRVREQQRLAQEQADQQAAREAANRAAQEAQANQVASENLLVAQYANIIRQLISRSWNIPSIARNGMSATVRLQLVPTGEVVAVNIVESSGNDIFDRSILQAVESADRFIELQDLENAVFERNFRTFTLVFRPEDLLR